MSDKENKSPITVKEEEIDLGKLFSLIGSAFSNLFSFIGKFLKNTFHYFIVFIIFLKEHLLKIGIATVLGATIGFVLDYVNPPVYTYDMIIEPNYGSIDQVFEKMEYYNVLASNRDSIALSKKFDISYKTANSIRSFELIPYETKKDIILAYDAFIKKTDTLTHKYFTFQDFKLDATSKFDSRRYVYRINSTSSKMDLFGDEILADIESNPTIQKRKRIQLYTLKLDSIAAVNALKEIENLRKLYEKVTLLEVEKETTPSASSTYLDFSKESKSNNKDIALFNISKELNNKLIDIEKSKETSEEIINIVTTFNPAGRIEGTFYETKMFKYGSLLGGLMVFFILIKKINIYLVGYKQQILN